MIINSEHYNLVNRKDEFLNSKPFPYLQLKNFLQKDFFDDFQNTNEKTKSKEAGISFDTDVEHKKWISKNSELSSVTKKIIDELSSDLWTNNLKNLTGISDLFCTTVGNTDLANYHEMKPGGLLAPHVDHSSEPETGYPHVLNIVVYLTKEWNTSWGGGTDLLNSNGSEIITKVPYLPNSAVIFLHTPFSFHGVSRIDEKAKFVRKSIYIDYYSQSFNPYKHINLDFKNKWFEHGTTFVLPKFKSYFKRENSLYRKIKLDYLINKFFN